MHVQAWVLGLSLLIAAGAAAQQASNLSGISGDEIKALQQRLAADGCYQGAIDGQASGALADAIKACPSQDPILRIETGMHVAQILRIGVDRACRIGQKRFLRRRRSSRAATCGRVQRFAQDRHLRRGDAKFPLYGRCEGSRQR